MRTAKSGVIPILLISLLAGPVTGVAAQDEADKTYYEPQLQGELTGTLVADTANPLGCDSFNGPDGREYPAVTLSGTATGTIPYLGEMVTMSSQHCLVPKRIIGNIRKGSFTLTDEGGWEVGGKFNGDCIPSLVLEEGASYLCTAMLKAKGAPFPEASTGSGKIRMMGEIWHEGIDEDGVPYAMPMELRLEGYYQLGDT